MNRKRRDLPFPLTVHTLKYLSFHCNAINYFTPAYLLLALKYLYVYVYVLKNMLRIFCNITLTIYNEFLKFTELFSEVSLFGSS